MHRYADKAPPLAASACRRALEDAGCSPSDIGQLVLVSCTGFTAPGIDIELFSRLGLRSDAGRTTVGYMGCHGAMNGLRVAQGLAESSLEDGRFVLLCCVELCTLHFQYGANPQHIVANALFADGAAAAVLASSARGTSAPKHFAVLAQASRLLPDTRDAMTWVIGDHGFEMTLSPRVPDLIRQHLRAFIEPWLELQNVTLADIGGWAIHPGGPRVISAVEDALDLPPGAGDASRHLLHTHGNMSSPTILFILDRLQLQNTPRPWVGLAFGPGLTIEACLVV
jgi:predicted naringenin-chalcone synthase